MTDEPECPVHGDEEFDWRSIAARVALADGAFHLLTTPERDALELAINTQRAAEDERDPLWMVRDAERFGMVRQAARDAGLGYLVDGSSFGPGGPLT